MPFPLVIKNVVQAGRQGTPKLPAKARGEAHEEGIQHSPLQVSTVLCLTKHDDEINYNDG